MKTVRISGRGVGGKYPCFIIAEIGSNHNQRIDIAYKLVDAAIAAGADAVKFQSFTVSEWISKELKVFPTVEEKENLHKLLKRCELPYADYAKIKKYCAKRGIICFSSPSSVSDIRNFLSIGIPAIKFGSVQITDIPVLKFAAKTGKPIILSTGASTMADISAAVRTIRSAGNDRIILLHCTVVYPAPFDKLNLKVMGALKRMFDLPVGFSDHSMDAVTAPVAAVAMGACVIEKHLTLDRNMKGPDHRFALDPKEFKVMVRAIRNSEIALGSPVKTILAEEKEIARLGRRSVVSRVVIPKGAIIEPDMLTTKRPGYGIQPKDMDKVIGMRTKARIDEDKVLRWNKLKKR